MLTAKPMSQPNASLQEAVGPASGVAEHGHGASGVLKLVVPLASLCLCQDTRQTEDQLYTRFLLPLLVALLVVLFLLSSCCMDRQ